MNDIGYVFLPGFLCDERLWSNQLQSLNSIPMTQTQVIDLRYCQDLDEMVNLVQKSSWKKFILVGFSMGGYVAQAFAARFPERIVSLCLVGATGFPLSATEIRARKAMETLLKKTQYRGISLSELRRFVHPSVLNQPEITNVILEMTASNTSEMYINQMNATLDRIDFKPDLQKYSFPITLIGGADDKIIPPHDLEEFQKKILRAKVQVIPECGHYIPLEKPAELNQQLVQLKLNIFSTPKKP